MPASLSELKERAQRARSELERRRGALEALQREAARRREALERATAQAERMAKVKAFLDEASASARELARQESETMVTEALQAVFGPRLRFRVQLGELRGRPHAEFSVEAETADGTPFAGDPVDAHGGGVVDVLALALRILLLESAQPRIEGPLFLDEPGKHVTPTTPRTWPRSWRRRPRNSGDRSSSSPTTRTSPPLASGRTGWSWMAA
ncbi:MAG TPA: hypothetical protein VIK73_09085 [Limnochordales bacterium]